MCVPIYKNLQLLAPQKGDKKNYITPGISNKKIAAALALKPITRVYGATLIGTVFPKVIWRSKA